MNPQKDCWACFPCGASGNAWKLAAFLAKISPDNKAAVTAWLRKHGLLEGRRQIVAVYPYPDANGKPIGRVVRTNPKGFYQERPDGKGGWEPGGFPPILFNLPEVLAAKSVLIVAGEKDAETAGRLGFVGTTNPGGEGHWREEFSTCLEGRHVCVVPDKDEPGRRHARAVCRSLLGKAEWVRLVELPGEHVKDLSDWVVAGGTREALLEVIKQTPELKREDVIAWQAPKPGPTPRFGDPWSAAVTAREFLEQAEADVEFLEERLLVRGLVTQFFSPRGVGKTLLAIWLAVKLALKGFRVLYLNRDNPPRVLRQYMESWHAHEAENLRVLNRDVIPALTNPVAWATFPWTEYDAVIVDSLDSTAEGVGEKDSAKPSLAIAPLLDIAHRDRGPAVLVLGNTVRTGAHSRGSGVIEDRGDVVYEIRDITGWTPPGNKPWWEEMPSAGAGDWAARTSRRRQREKIRLAFVCTKLRGLEPEPFVMEIDFTSDSWTLTEVTDEVDRAGKEARESRRREREQAERNALEALQAEIEHRAEASQPPMQKEQDAVPFLMRLGLRRGQARRLLVAGHGKSWNLAPGKGKHGRAVTVIPMGLDQHGGEKLTAPEVAETKDVTDHISRREHEQATARKDHDEASVSKSFDNGALVAADPKHSAGELPFDSAAADNGEVEL